MGMTGHYRHVGAATLAALVARPELSVRIAVHEPPHPSGLPRQLREMFAHAPAEQAASLAAMLRASWEETNGQTLEASAAESCNALRTAGLDPEDIAESISIDKAWHGLHLVLSGSATDVTPPLGNAVLGGTEIGDDLAYGPMRYLTVGEVQATAAALSALSVEEFRAKCSLPALAAADAYAIDPDNPEEIEWLEQAFVKVRDYFDEAARLDRAMLLSLG